MAGPALIGPAGQHLLRTADLAFGMIEDPGEAVETATELVWLMLEHAPPEDRRAAGLALLERALS